MSSFPAGRTAAGRTRLLVLAAAVLVALVATGCDGFADFLPPKERQVFLSPVRVTGPDTVAAGEPATFVADGVALNGGSPCPQVVSWHFEDSPTADPALLNPATRMANGACVTDGVTVTHVF